MSKLTHVFYNTDKEVALETSRTVIYRNICGLRAGAIMESIVSTSDCLTDSITLLNHISKLLDDRKVFEAKQAFVNFLQTDLCATATFFEVAARIVENESDASAKVAAARLTKCGHFVESVFESRGGESKSNQK